MDLIAMAAQLDTTLGAVAGIVSHFPQHPDSIPDTPCLVVMQPRLRTATGSHQRTTFDWPVRIYFDAIADEGRVLATMNPFVNAVLAALALINSAQSAANLWAVITGIDTDTTRRSKVGDVDYFVLEFVIHMEQLETVSTYGAI